MRKVLVVITTQFVAHDGLATVMMNYYRNINKDGLRIDFASTNELQDDSIHNSFDTETKYFNLGNRKKGLFRYLINLYRLLRKERYDVIHVNGNSATMIFELFVARLCGVLVRIAHGHNTRTSYPKAHKLLSPFLKRTYTSALAPSRSVGDWLYDNKYIVLNNAIDVKRYGFSQGKRELLRNNFNLNGKYVVGHIGRMSLQKNHRFLLEIFSEIKKKRKDAVLVLAGGGALDRELKTYAADLKIEDAVVFLGMINDASSILQAMDVFVFPSLFEGLGLALVEAQAAGLECIASTAVPPEAKVSPNVKFLSLDEPATLWAERILEIPDYARSSHSQTAAESIRKSGYDIRFEANKLRNIYMA